MVHTNFYHFLYPVILHIQSHAMLHLCVALYWKTSLVDLYSAEVFEFFERVVLFPVKQCHFSTMM